MGQSLDLSPKKVGQIWGLLKAGNHSQYKIAKLVGVSRSSVKNVKKKIDSRITLTPKRVNACGRRRITTPRTDRRIREICLQNRKLPLQLLTKSIVETGIKVSDRTVRLRLQEEGLIARRPVRKPRLTPTMIKKRLQWAKKYRKFTIEDWRRVIY